MLLVSVIIGVSSFILGILIAVQAFNTASVSTDSFSWVSIVGFFIEFVTQFIQMILIFITMLWAFSLYEKKFAVGMQQKLNEIGNTESDSNNDDQPLII